MGFRGWGAASFSLAAAIAVAIVAAIAAAVAAAAATAVCAEGSLHWVVYGGCSWWSRGCLGSCV